jgi:hypothetical protein
VVGDVDKNSRLDTSAYNAGLPSSITGSNVVWDFSKVIGMYPVMFDSILSPSAAAGASLFPAATYVQSRSGINSFFKSNASPSQTELIGVYSPSLTITFTNSAIVLTYPGSYGYSATDPVTGTFKYNTTTGVCNGSINVVADGIGTLKLPDNVSFQNVLRFKSVQQLTMTASLLPIGTINQSVYAYYVSGKKFPILTVQYQKYQFLVGTPTITAIAYGNFNYFTIAGIDKTSLDKKSDVYPNPFHDKLFLKEDNNKVLREFRFYNFQGQLLSQITSLEDFSGNELQPGIYFLEIKDESGSYFKKLIKE